MRGALGSASCLGPPASTAQPPKLNCTVLIPHPVSMDPEAGTMGDPDADGDEVNSPPAFGANRSQSLPGCPQRRSPSSPQLSSDSTPHKRKYVERQVQGRAPAGPWPLGRGA